MRPRPPAQKSHAAGIAIVIALALIFFALLIAIIDYVGDNRKPDSRQQLAQDELYVVPIALRIRTQPTVKGPVLARATRGEKLKLVEDHGAWVKVQNGEGITGWAERSGLEGAAEHKRRIERSDAIRRLPPLDGKVDRRAPLYAGPGIFYPLVGEIAPGTRVKVFTRDHDFYALDLGGDIAYAEVDAIDVTAVDAPKFEVAGQQPAGLPPAATETSEPDVPESIAEAPSLAPIEGSQVYPAVPPGGTEPEIVERPMPPYPILARRAGIEGTVILRAVVRKSGSVDSVQILRDLPFGLGEAARNAVEQWRFRPATYNGDPIDVYYTVTVNFRLTD